MVHEYYIPQIATQFFAMGIVAGIICVLMGRMTMNDPDEAMTHVELYAGIVVPAGVLLINRILIVAPPRGMPAQLSSHSVWINSYHTY